MSYRNVLRQLKHKVFVEWPNLGAVILGVISAVIVSFLSFCSGLTSSLIKANIQMGQNGELTFAPVFEAIVSSVPVILLIMLVLLMVFGRRSLRYPRHREALLSRFLGSARRIYSFETEIRFTYKLHRTIYEANLNKKDEIRAKYAIANPGRPLHFIRIFHTSTEPLLEMPELNLKTDTGTAVELPATDEPTLKRWLVYFSPVVEDIRTLEYSATWENFWRPLREGSSDHIEYTPTLPTDEAEVILIFPLQMGHFVWDKGNKIRGEREDDGIRQKLVTKIHSPTPGITYYLGVRRVETPGSTVGN